VASTARTEGDGRQSRKEERDAERPASGEVSQDLVEATHAKSPAVGDLPAAR
jgi:hypothetical protein